jgi:hypothetical protein
MNTEQNPNEVQTVVVTENRRMGWFEVEVNGFTWRFPTMEMTMQDVTSMVGPVKFEWRQE